MPVSSLRPREQDKTPGNATSGVPRARSPRRGTPLVLGRAAGSRRERASGGGQRGPYLVEDDGGLVEADVGGEGALTLADGGQRADLPRARGREEPELALRGGHHLGGELVGRVEQPDVRAGHRGTVVPDLALDHRLAVQVDAREAAALLGGSAHAQAPFSIGTPTREPYSVHEPS